MVFTLVDHDVAKIGCLLLGAIICLLPTYDPCLVLRIAAPINQLISANEPEPGCLVKAQRQALVGIMKMETSGE